MNFNKLEKLKIDKTEFNSLFNNTDENIDKICMNLYKLASIVAYKKGILDPDRRQDVVQDAVFTAYKRRDKYNKSQNSAYSFFYKVLENHFKDIFRKYSRRESICKMSSFDLTEDNVYFNYMYKDGELESNMNIVSHPSFSIYKNLKIKKKIKNIKSDVVKLKNKHNHPTFL